MNNYCGYVETKRQLGNQWLSHDNTRISYNIEFVIYNVYCVSICLIALIQ